MNESQLRNDVFEYHLAPVWHDAKTDPPKEGIKVVGGWRNSLNWNRFILSDGEWLEWGYDFDAAYYGWIPATVKPEIYMIPKPPKESEG